MDTSAVQYELMEPEGTLANANCASNHGKIQFKHAEHQEEATIDPETNTVVRTSHLRYIELSVSENGEFSYQKYERITLEIYDLREREGPATSDDNSSENDCRQKCNKCLCGRIERDGSMSNLIQKEVKVMLKAREKGWEFLKCCIFPLVSVYWREVWIYYQFVIALALMLYHVISFASDGSERMPLDIAALVFSLMSSALTIIDLLVSIYSHRCRIFRHCVALIRHRKIEDENADNRSNCIHQCCKLCFLNDYSDVFRSLLSELFVYPIVVCSMFRFVIGLRIGTAGYYRTWKGILKIIFFALPIIWNILTVYVLRLVVLLVVIKTVQGVKKTVGAATNTATIFHIRFFLHVLGHMASQGFMIAFLGCSYYMTNKNAEDAGSFKIGRLVWFQIVGALLLPLFGVLAFALPNYLEFQEYPIQHFIVIFKYLKKNKKKCYESKDSKEEMQEAVIKILEAGLKPMHQASCCNKFFYALRTPGLLILSTLYGNMVSFFVYTSALTIPTGWGIFYAVAITWIFLANVKIIIITWVSSIFLPFFPLCLCYCFFSKIDKNC